MWRALTEERGIGGRDQIWEHPDLLPTAEDLDDPEGFVRGRPELDLSGLTEDGTTAGPDAEPPAGPEPAGGTGPAGETGPGGEPETGSQPNLSTGPLRPAHLHR